MDTRTGEIFPRDEAGTLVQNPAQTQAAYLAAELRMRDAEARGDLVPVSDRVAALLEDGQRVQRKRRRRAAKRARRANR